MDSALAPAFVTFCETPRIHHVAESSPTADAFVLECTEPATLAESITAVCTAEDVTRAAGKVNSIYRTDRGVDTAG